MEFEVQILGLASQPGDDLLHRGPGDGVAQVFGGAEDLEGDPLLLGDVVAEEVLVLQPYVLEMGVIHDGVLDSRLGQGLGQVGLPDPLSQPGPCGLVAEVISHRLGELLYLASLVGIVEGHQDGLVVAAGHHLYLAASHQCPDALDQLRPVLGHPIAQRPRVMKGHLDGGVALQCFDHRLVSLMAALLEDPIEVPHGLMIVDGQGKVDVFQISNLQLQTSNSSCLNSRAL